MSSADFTCAICLDTASEPVVTRCGHLFCWGCLDSWLCSPQAGDACPVCKGRVDKHITGDVIPLYGKGKRGAADPRPGAGPSPAAASHGTNSNSSSSNTASSRSAPPHAASPRPAAGRAPTPPRRHQPFQQRVSLIGGSSFLIFGGNMWLSVVCIIAWAIFQFAPWRTWSEQLASTVRNANPNAESNNTQTRAGNSNNSNNNADREVPTHRRSTATAAPPPPRPEAVVPQPELLVRNLAVSMVVLVVLMHVVNSYV